MKKLKASDLIKILEKRIKEFGDLEISVNTQEGGSYNLYGADAVSIVTWKTKDGRAVETLEIG